MVVNSGVWTAAESNVLNKMRKQHRSVVSCPARQQHEWIQIIKFMPHIQKDCHDRRADVFIVSSRGFSRKVFCPKVFVV